MQNKPVMKEVLTGKLLPLWLKTTASCINWMKMGAVPEVD